MKKFLLLAAAGMMALSGSATMYIIGQPGGGWDPTKGVELEEVEPGVYQYTGNIGGQYFAFADQLGTNSGDWGTLNAHRWGPSSNNQLAGVGEYNAVYAKDASWCGGTGELTYTLNTNTKKLIVTGQVIADEITYVVHGDLASTTWQDFTLTEKGGKWEGDITATKNGNFGIKKNNHGNQVGWISAAGNSAVTVNQVMNCSDSGTNFSIAAGEYHFSFDPEAMTLLVTGEGGEIEVDYSGWYVNVVGDFNSWGDNGVNPNTDGVSKHTALPIGTSGFKIKVWNGEDIWYSNGEALPVNTPVTISGNEDAPMTIEGAEEGQLFDVTFDVKTGVLTIIGDTEKPDYTTWYVNVVGNFNEWVDNGVAANEEGVATLENLAIGTSDFKIKVWNGTADVWYSNGEANAVDTPIVINGNSDANMTIADAEEGGVYNVSFDCATRTMTLTKVAVEVEYPELVLYGAGYTDPDTCPVFTLNDGVYTVTLENLAEGEEDPWFAASLETMNVCAVKEGTEVKANTEFEVYYIDYSTLFGGNEWAPVSFATEHSVTITISGDKEAFAVNSFKPLTMKLDVQTDVKTVEIAEESEAVYYNLQGVRVANPENGLYIKVQGDKAVKVAL